jgi:hypothetical protein
MHAKILGNGGKDPLLQVPWSSGLRYTQSLKGVPNHIPLIRRFFYIGVFFFGAAR